MKKIERRTVKVSDLKPYEHNEYYFDDLEGDIWGELIYSIKENGVLTPIIITTDNTIVAGHQRCRACQYLHIEEIDADIMEFENEDEILTVLIETNIKQRNAGNPNPIKMGNCLRELERIYGIRNGSAGNADPNNSGGVTQEDLAKQFGISTDTLRDYKALADAIPELQTLVENGAVTKTTALGIIRRLPKEEQAALADQLFQKYDRGASKKQIKAEVDKAIRKTKEEAEEKQKAALQEKENEIEELQARVEELEASKEAPNDPDDDTGEVKLSREARFEKQRADRLQEENRQLWERIDKLEQERHEQIVKEISKPEPDEEPEEPKKKPSIRKKKSKAPAETMGQRLDRICDFMEEPTGERNTIDEITHTIKALEKYQDEIQVTMEQLRQRRYKEFLVKKCDLSYALETEPNPLRWGLECPTGKAHMYLIRDHRNHLLFDFFVIDDKGLDNYKLNEIDPEYWEDAQCMYIAAREEYKKRKAECEEKSNKIWDEKFKAGFEGLKHEIKNNSLEAIPEDHRRQIERVLYKAFHPDNGGDGDVFCSAMFIINTLRTAE